MTIFYLTNKTFTSSRISCIKTIILQSCLNRFSCVIHVFHLLPVFPVLSSTATHERWTFLESRANTKVERFHLGYILVNVISRAVQYC